MAIEFWPGYSPMAGLSGNFFDKAGITGISPVAGDNMSTMLASLMKNPSFGGNMPSFAGNMPTSVTAPPSGMGDMAGAGIGAGLNLAQSLVDGNLTKHPVTTIGKTAGSAAGGLAGAAAGSMLMPGVGTYLGSVLGSQLGGMAGGALPNIGAK